MSSTNNVTKPHAVNPLQVHGQSTELDGFTASVETYPEVVVEPSRLSPVLVRASVDRFVRFLETGAVDGLFADGVFGDITLPRWREQTVGADRLVAMKTRMHPPGGRTRVEKVLAGPRGYTLKVEERWEDGGQRWYCREAFLCDLDDQGRIVELSAYCTGDWDEAAVAAHTEAVTLIRP